MRKLPDSEFEVMKVVWESYSPVNAVTVMEGLDNHKDWKVQTIISLLSRLVEKGFLSTEKNGKERTYSPLISRDDYLKFETSNFVERFHQNSCVSLINTLYRGNKLKSEDLDELLQWLKERK